MMMKLLSSLLLLPSLSTAYRTEGFPCRAHFQCESEYCNSTLQCAPKGANAQSCTVHDACQSGRCGGGVCQVQYQPGQGPCQVNEDCYEGYCNVANSTNCIAWLPRFNEAQIRPDMPDQCTADHQCRSGRCTAKPKRCQFVIHEGAICGKDADCHGDRCKTIEQGGDNRCYPRQWNDQACHHNADCLSLRCETQNCTEPVWLGQPCDEPSDCYSLFCNTEKGVCVRTAAEAGNDKIEAEAPGITGSLAQEKVNGGGSVDLGEGETFESQEGGGGSGAVPEMSRAFFCGILGVAAVVVMV